MQTLRHEVNLSCFPFFVNCVTPPLQGRTETPPYVCRGASWYTPPPPCLPCTIWKKRAERPNVGGVSIRCRNGAQSRKGCVVNCQMTETSDKWVPPPPSWHWGPALKVLSHELFEQPSLFRVVGALKYRSNHRVLFAFPSLAPEGVHVVLTPPPPL